MLILCYFTTAKSLCIFKVFLLFTHRKISKYFRKIREWSNNIDIKLDHANLRVTRMTRQLARFAYTSPYISLLPTHGTSRLFVDVVVDHSH